MKYSFSVILLVIIASSLTMCKSKEVVESLEPFVYQVKLVDNAKIKAVLKDIPHTATDFTRSSRTENKWRVTFVNEGAGSKSINKSLLNHSSVVIAMLERGKDQGRRNKDKKTSGFKTRSNQ